jgi:NAD(P)-dependent dehydrogenase (short-subunit alcohol dehydrogenase family)
VSKVIVITGAGAGLGRALARRFAADGETVVALGRTASKVEAVAKECGDKAMAVTCDVASPDSVKAAFAAIAKRHPKIDVLINNAGIFVPFTITEATDDQILNTIATNLTGPMLCTRSAIPLMCRGGHIMNVTSESVEQPFPYLSAYVSSKAGLERFSKATALEVEPNGIRVTIVRAGSMIDPENMTWNIDPEMGKRFHAAAAAIGIDLMKRPLSQVKSVTNIFRALVDLPTDVQASIVSLHGRNNNS